MTSILLKNVSFIYSNATRPSLDGIDLSIDQGEFILIAGPSGCGKSTLCFTLNGVIPHLIHGVMKGEIRIDGINSGDLSMPRLSKQVGMVFQNPDNQIFALTVEEDVAFGPENLGLEHREMLERVNNALTVTGIAFLRERLVYHLSGGQKQRCAISGSIAMRPDVLVLDEPTADLDPDGTAQVIRTLHDLNRDQGMTIVLVEHKVKDLYPVIVPDRVIRMVEGKIIDIRPGSELSPEEILNCTVAIPEKNVKEGVIPSINPLYTFSNVSFTFPDKTRVLDTISFKVGEGEFLAIIGENGCGKSTLLMHMNRLLDPTGGQVFFEGIDLRRMKHSSIVQKAGYLFQNPDNQIFMGQVYDEIAVGLKAHGLSSHETDAKVRHAASSVGIGHLLDRDPNTLSRGERQRLAVASILALEPKVLLLDEPTTGQDYGRLMHLVAYLLELNRNGTTVVMVTHDIPLAVSVSDRILVMKRGSLVREINRPYPALADILSEF
jgi:energy-coupling factor transport system ATP-binding protein